MGVLVPILPTKGSSFLILHFRFFTFLRLLFFSLLKKVSISMFIGTITQIAWLLLPHARIIYLTKLFEDGSDLKMKIGEPNYWKVRDDFWISLGDFFGLVGGPEKTTRTQWILENSSINLQKMNQILTHKIDKDCNSRSPLLCFQLRSHLVDKNFVFRLCKCRYVHKILIDFNHKIDYL